MVGYEYDISEFSQCLVDAVKEVISIAESKIEKAVQGVASDKTMYLNGIGKYNNELVSLLNIDSVLGVKE